MSGGTNVESEHVFLARAEQIGLAEPIRNALKTNGIATFGKFAFASAYQPGGADETPLVNLITKILGREADVAEMAVVRRLFLECHAASLQDMRNRVERPSDAAPTKIMPAERSARYHEQSVRLVGISITGAMEPSHALVDLVFAMLEDNQLRYIPLHNLTSREQELIGEREDPDLKSYSLMLKSGTLTAKEKESTVKADLTSDLKVRYALQRRALAFDQAGLITYSVQDNWISSLFGKMQETPMDNFAFVSMEQCLRADRKLFVKIAEECRSSIVPTLGSPRPLDVAINRFRDHPDVLFYLLPVPKHDQHKQRSSPYPSNHQNSSKGSKSKGKGKGKQGQSKGKGKGKNKSFAPQGCQPWTDGGQKVCFGFNGDGCYSNVEVGKSCSKGFHVCGKKGCGGLHSLKDCPRE